MSATEGSVQPVRVEAGDARLSLRLEGVVNAAQARRLKEEALAVLAGSGPVTLDLARAEYLDGAAMQVLLALQAGLAAKGREFHVVAMAPSIEDTLRLAGLAGLLDGGPPAPAGSGRPS